MPVVVKTTHGGSKRTRTGGYVNQGRSARPCRNSGLEPRLRPGPERARLGRRLGRHHEDGMKPEAAADKGVQADRGDLREIQNRVRARTTGNSREILSVHSVIAGSGLTQSQSARPFSFPSFPRQREPRISVTCSWSRFCGTTNWTVRRISDRLWPPAFAGWSRIPSRNTRSRRSPKGHRAFVRPEATTAHDKHRQNAGRRRRASWGGDGNDHSEQAVVARSSLAVAAAGTLPRPYGCQCGGTT